MTIMSIGNLVPLVGLPVLRSATGWLQHAWDDGKIDFPEVKLLISTILRVGVPGIVLFLGLDAIGVDYAAVVGGSVAFLMDKFFAKK